VDTAIRRAALLVRYPGFGIEPFQTVAGLQVELSPVGRRVDLMDWTP
jgi:hypothetical protein